MTPIDLLKASASTGRRDHSHGDFDSSHRAILTLLFPHRSTAVGTDHSRGVS